MYICIKSSINKENKLQIQSQNVKLKTKSAKA